MGTADIVGLAASASAFVMWLPQARLVWASRRDPQRLAGVSIGTQVMLLTNAVLWGVYSVLDAFWGGAPGVVNAPLAVLSTVLLVRARQATQPDD